MGEACLVLPLFLCFATCLQLLSPRPCAPDAAACPACCPPFPHSRFPPSLPAVLPSIALPPAILCCRAPPWSWCTRWGTTSSRCPFVVLPRQERSCCRRCVEPRPPLPSLLPRLLSPAAFPPIFLPPTALFQDHSSFGTDEYGDQTCAMGSCCHDRCYNTPRAWHLGWVSVSAFWLLAGSSWHHVHAWHLGCISMCGA